MNDPKTAFVFISCGPHAHTYKAETCIESLYNITGWEGKAYLITDSPDCFDLNKLRKDCGSDQVSLISVPRFSGKFDFPFSIIKTASGNLKGGFVQAWTRSKSKSIKARLFDLITEERIDNLIYLDADAFFIQSKPLKKLLRVANDWPSEGVKFKVNKWSGEKGQFDSNCIIHTGFFIINRNKSKRALEVWDRNMSDLSQWIGDGTDKAKYMKGFRDIEESGEENYMMVHDLTRKFERVFKNEDMKSLSTHLTFPRIKEIGYERMEKYVASFGFKSFPKGYYCMPGMPMWLYSFFYHGHIPYRGSYKIEDVWKKWRKRFGVHKEFQG